MIAAQSATQSSGPQPPRKCIHCVRIYPHRCTGMGKLVLVPQAEGQAADWLHACCMSGTGPSCLQSPAQFPAKRH